MVSRSDDSLAFTVDQGKTTNVVAFVTDRSKSPNERKWEGHPRLKGKDRNEEPVPWVEPVDKQFMMDDYEGWCPDIQKLLNVSAAPSFNNAIADEIGFISISINQRAGLSMS